MARNGSGTYNRAVSPYTAGTVITAATVNQEMDDIATALTGSMARDGQSPATANIPMGGHRLTGLGNGIASTDAAALGQITAAQAGAVANSMATARVLGRVTAGSGAVEEIPLGNAAAALSLGINRGTAQNTTSGSQIDFTDIPAGVRRITLMFNNVSAGTADYFIQLGDSGGIETTGYLGSSVSTIVGATPTVTGSNLSTGFLISSANADNTWVGAITFTAFNATTWIAWGIVGRSAGGTNPIATVQIAGLKVLSDTLDRIRLSTTTGTFDNGSIIILWEF